MWKDSRQGTFAILDGARDEEIHAGLLRWTPEQRCLYAGELSPVMAQVAPYLVPLPRKSLFTNWVIEHGWGDSWSIFFQSFADLNVLRRHFRQFLKVKDEHGKNMYFRYYDPRVLRVYLPTCNKEELEKLFGPVTSYYAEGETADQLLEFSLLEGQLIQNTITLNKITSTGKKTPA
jgi:hypothetical protein